MKKILLLFVLIQFQWTDAQIKSGVVEYKVISEKVELNNKKVSKATKEIIGNMPRYLSYISFTLTFNRTESFYRQNETMELEGNERYHIKHAKITAGTSRFYTNYKSDKKLIEKSFLGNEFLVSAKFNTKEWTITKETKMIDSYSCYKAVYIDKDNPLLSKPRVVIAWFTMDIPIPFGPKGYGGLPGLILELKEGPLTYFASSVTLSKDVKEIDEPIMGEPIAEEDYIDIVLEKSKKFERNQKNKQ